MRLAPHHSPKSFAFAADEPRAASSNPLAGWLEAVRPRSHLVVALALVVGQVVAMRTSALDGITFAAVMLFGALHALHVAFARDVADEAADSRETTLALLTRRTGITFPASPSREGLAWGALVCATGAVAVSVALALHRDAPVLILFAALSVVFVWMHGQRPLRLVDRGLGETLEAIGLGIGLPLYGYLAQAGTLEGFPWALLVALFPAHMALALADSLPSTASDASRGRRTLAVRLGGERAAWVVSGLGLLALLFVTDALRALGERADKSFLIPLACSLLVLAAGPAPIGSRMLRVRGALATTSLLAFMVALLDVLV